MGRNLVKTFLYFARTRPTSLLNNFFIRYDNVQQQTNGFIPFYLLINYIYLLKLLLYIKRY